jgi:hypothetical protein
MLHNEPLLDRANHRLQRLELSCQYDQARTGINGQTGILFVRNDRQQLLEPLASLRCHNLEFSTVIRSAMLSSSNFTPSVQAGAVIAVSLCF